MAGKCLVVSLSHADCARHGASPPAVTMIAAMRGSLRRVIAPGGSVSFWTMAWSAAIRFGMAAMILSTASANAAVSYTCATNIDTTVPGLCSQINATVAPSYNNTFTNINASIYVQFGNTGLGGSNQILNFVSYSSYISAATANAKASAVQTAAAAGLKTYAAPIYGTGSVVITAALGASLGVSGMFGLGSDGNFCKYPGTACYAGIITITNNPSTKLYYRTGSEPANGFDFFAIVEHETDELLGTASCVSTGGATLVDNCGAAVPAAADLFRFSAPGRLVTVSAPSTTPGAYFSYDGGATDVAAGLFYNTLSNGADYADFASSCPGTLHVQDAFACGGHDGGLDITNDGFVEINMLNALGYTLSATAVGPGTPSINASGVVTSGTTLTTIEAGSWVAIYGTNFSSVSRAWDPAIDIVNGNLPVSLSGVSAKINGKSAYVYYVSPTQINVQAPDDTATGSVNVTVTNQSGTSTSTIATLAAVSPAFFTLDGKYAAGVIPATGGAYLPGTANSYDLLGPSGKFPYNTRPVKKGELLELYMTGFGAGNPAVPAGQVFSGASPTVASANNSVSLSIGGFAITPTPIAYVTGAGLYQMNVTIPANLGSGDNALSAIVNGVPTPAGIFIAVQ